MLWEGNRQIQEYTNKFVFTTVYDEDGFVPVARVVQSRQPQDNAQGNGNDNAELFKVYHYHNTHLGTPQELTDDCGEVVWCNYEFAWGGRYTHHYTSQSLNNCAIIESDLQPIRFQGQFFDPETSLHYNRFRYYDSDVGMFISRDPIGLMGGVNVFAYAPNPIGWVDVLGLNRSTCSCKQSFKEYKEGTSHNDSYIFPKTKTYTCTYSCTSDKGSKFIINYTNTYKKGWFESPGEFFVCPYVSYKEVDEFNQTTLQNKITPKVTIYNFDPRKSHIQEIKNLGNWCEK